MAQSSELIRSFSRKAEAARDWVLPFPHAWSISFTTACANTATFIAWKSEPSPRKSLPTLPTDLPLPKRWGVVVADVKPDSPAAAAGLRIQDIVLTADDRPIETLPSLTSALYLHRLDQVLKMEIRRGDEKKTLYIPAVEHHDQMDQLLDAANPDKSLVPRLGVLAIDLTDDLRSAIDNLRISSGVLGIGRAAALILADTCLQGGDVIHQVNTTPIDSMDALRGLLANLKTGDPVVIQLERDSGLMYVSFEME